MGDARQEFNDFIRRWQVRLFIAGFILPTLFFLGLVFGLGRESDGAAVGGVLMASAFFLTALLLQLWRVGASRKRSGTLRSGAVVPASD